MNLRLSHHATHPRRGSMVPALALALLVVGGAMALVFDRLWQDAAFIELRTTGEAAALAAAIRLADDDTLKTTANWETICQAARTAASDIAAKNTVGGQPVKLWDDADGAVELGRDVEDSTGTPVFVRTDERPNCVHVNVEQGRGPSNPVGLLVRDVTGAGRLLQTTVMAKANNCIAGVRPFEAANVPILPIAISAMSPTGWNAAIDQHVGLDTCGVSRGTITLTPGPDGIPEMIAWSSPMQATPREQMLATLHVFDIGNGLSGEDLSEQCRDGWSMDDLRKHNGELRIDGKPLTLPSTPKIPIGVAGELAKLIGQTRLCLVYDAALPGTSPDRWTIVSHRLVAVRILAVQPSPDGAVVLQLQPAVVVTRTAIVGEEGDDQLLNPYVYKVSLMN